MTTIKTMWDLESFIEHLDAMVSCEDEATVYVCFPDVRLIFREGEYVGFYVP